MNMRQQTLAWSLALGLGLLASTAVSAHGPMSGQGEMGPYMHGGMGPGMMGGQGGMGPGMMGGQGGMGPGMMGGQGGMGPGMMGGQGGMGPGMMGGQGGMGPGMMGGQGGMGPGMMGGQGGMGPGMMGGQGGMGPGMMGGQGGMGPGMMGGQGGMGPGMMGGQGGMGPGMMGDQGLLLLLDEQQQRDMLDIRKKYRDTQIERMSKMMDMRDEMMFLMNQPTPDPDAIKSLHVRMAELHGDMMADRIRMQNEIHGLLTEEQRQQLQQGMSQP